MISVEVRPRWGSPFEPTFLFPRISLNDILELEFQVARAMQISMNFDNKEFFEFIWLYERLAEERKRENEQAARQQGMQYFGSGGVSSRTIGAMGG